MSQIKSKNTRPEQIVRHLLWTHGYRYRLHYKKLPGKPDIVFPGKKKVIFINGCFWHKHDCKYFHWPKTNVEFWKKKIEANFSRDNTNLSLLKEMGWDIFVVWECEIKTVYKDELLSKISAFLD